MWTRFLISTLVLTFSLSSQARRTGYSYVSLVSQAHYYHDLLQEDGPDLEINPDVSLNLEIRTYRVFSILLTGGTAFDSSRVFYGFGFRADLPGFFMFGGNINDLIHRKRRKGVTTYFSASALLTEMPGEPKAIVAGRYALGMDIDLNHTFFINIEPSLYSHGGNQFLSLGAGLGIEF